MAVPRPGTTRRLAARPGTSEEAAAIDQQGRKTAEAAGEHSFWRASLPDKLKYSWYHSGAYSAGSAVQDDEFFRLIRGAKVDGKVVAHPGPPSPHLMKYLQQGLMSKEAFDSLPETEKISEAELTALYKEDTQLVQLALALCSEAERLLNARDASPEDRLLLDRARRYVNHFIKHLRAECDPVIKPDATTKGQWKRGVTFATPELITIALVMFNALKQSPPAVILWMVATAFYSLSPSKAYAYKNNENLDLRFYPNLFAEGNLLFLIPVISFIAAVFSPAANEALNNDPKVKIPWITVSTVIEFVLLLATSHLQEIANLHPFDKPDRGTLAGKTWQIAASNQGQTQAVAPNWPLSAVQQAALEGNPEAIKDIAQLLLLVCQLMGKKLEHLKSEDAFELGPTLTVKKRVNYFSAKKAALLINEGKSLANALEHVAGQKLEKMTPGERFIHFLKQVPKLLEAIKSMFQNADAEKLGYAILGTVLVGVACYFVNSSPVSVADFAAYAAFVAWLLTEKCFDGTSRQLMQGAFIGTCSTAFLGFGANLLGFLGSSGKIPDYLHLGPLGSVAVPVCVTTLVLLMLGPGPKLSEYAAKGTAAVFTAPGGLWRQFKDEESATRKFIDNFFAKYMQGTRATAGRLEPDLEANLAALDTEIPRIVGGEGDTIEMVGGLAGGLLLPSEDTMREVLNFVTSLDPAGDFPTDPAGRAQVVMDRARLHLDSLETRRPPMLNEEDFYRQVAQHYEIKPTKGPLEGDDAPAKPETEAGRSDEVRSAKAKEAAETAKTPDTEAVGTPRPQNRFAASDIEQIIRQWEAEEIQPDLSDPDYIDHAGTSLRAFFLQRHPDARPTEIGLFMDFAKSRAADLKEAYDLSRGKEPEPEAAS